MNVLKGKNVCTVSEFAVNLYLGREHPEIYLCPISAIGEIDKGATIKFTLPINSMG